MLLNRLVSGGCADAFKVAAVRLDELDVPMILYTPHRPEQPSCLASVYLPTP